MNENQNPRRLRILQVVDGFRMGGAEKKLLELVAKLDRKKFEVLVANVGPGGQLEKAFGELGVEIFDFSRRFGFDPLPLWRLFRLIRQRRIDLVQTTLLWADLIGPLAAKWAGVPAVVSWETVSHEGDPFHNNLQRRVGYEWAMQFVDVIIPVSEEIKRSLMRRRGIPEHKIRVVHYGVDLKKFHPNGHDQTLAKRLELGAARDDVLIGILARLEPPKGHRFFVEAFAEIIKRFPRARAIFAGDGSLRAELEAGIRQAGLGERIRLLGTRDDVTEILNAIDLFVLPSISEGLPNVLLEAMACQKPVIATEIGGIPEVIRHGENGYLAPPADATALQATLLQCLAEREKWESLAHQARRTVEDRFSLEHQIACFEAIFEEIHAVKIGKKKKAPPSRVWSNGRIFVEKKGRMKRLIHNAFINYLRHFPLPWGKNRLFNALWKPVSFGEYRRQATLRQANVKMSCDLTNFLQRYIYFYGSYEEEYCDYWIQLAGEASTIFDVGTNVGLYSLLAAAANQRACIHAFEPTPEIVAAFKKNIQLNRMRNISVTASAVGSQTGKGYLKRHRHGAELYDWMNYVSAAASRSDDVPINLIALDDYCSQKQIARIDLLKMDIEGGEYDALRGAEKLLQAQAIGCIFLELVESHATRSGHSTVEIKRLLIDAGYRICRLQAGALAAVEPEKIHDGEGDNVIAFAREFKFAPESMREAA
jgi:FkbM family methyltransferase